MAYCIFFHPKLRKLMDKVDEIGIRYNRKDKTLQRYMLEKSDKRFIIDLNVDATDEDYQILFDIKQKHPELNMALRINYIALEDAKQRLAQCAESGVPAFLNTVAKDWDVFNGLMSLGVSDIYIGEDLGFDLVQVAKVAHSRGIRLRTFPNVCQTSWRDTDPLKTFFIRPEDIDFYSQYIDSYEFFTDSQPIGTLYKIYAEDKKWFGNLQELIIGFNYPLDSRALLDTFAEKRVKCRKKCAQGRGCLLCDRYAELAKTMSENSLYFKR